MKAKSDINFEAKDFERYYSGKMSGKEMYALEKAALADSFLQEALEGYQYTRSAVADIDALQEKLSNRLAEKKEARIILWSKNNFLKAAVLIAFLAGAAVIFLIQNNNQIENNELASTSPAEISEVKADTALQSSGNNLAVLEAPSTTASSTPIIELNKTDKNKYESKEKQIDKSVARSAPVEAEAYAEDIAVAAAPVLRNEKIKEGFLVTGKVVNEQGEPVSFASIVTNKEQINTDITGNYSAYIKDSSLYGNVVATGYMPLQKKLNPNQSQTIILNSDIAKADKLAEVSISRVAKKAAVSDKDNTGRNAEAMVVSTLVPKVGWPEFEKYLKDSVRYQNDKRAIVQLSFTVNELGRPQEIKVIDGLCLPCNTEAIRLLSAGPDWKPAPKGKGILKVQF